MTEFVDAGECAIEVITRKEWNREYADGNAVPKGVKVVLLSAMGEPLLAIAGTLEALELFVDEMHVVVGPDSHDAQIERLAEELVQLTKERDRLTQEVREHRRTMVAAAKQLRTTLAWLDRDNPF